MAIEVEIWKLWVLSQGFVFKRPWGGPPGRDGRMIDQDILEHLYEKLHEASLWDLYGKTYNQTFSKDIESEADLTVVISWAKNRRPFTYLKFRRRKLPSIQEAATLFGECGQLE
jgi:hypothetical protein